jgi:serine protease DegQ
VAARDLTHHEDREQERPMTETALQLSEQLAGIVDRTEKSIVRVGDGRRPHSGVAWATAGVVVTTAGAVDDGGGATLHLSGGGVASATLVGRDPGTDLAVLRLDDAGAAAVPPAAWAPARSLKVGHLVLTMGRPGRGPRATLGMVSGLGGDWRTPLGSPVDRYIEVDGSFLKGFTGGALVDLSGAVVGLNVAGLIHEPVTLPFETVQRVVDDLLREGKVRRGYLGATVQPIALPLRVAEAEGQRAGMLVTSVEPGSPAAVAGIFLGDTLLTLGGQRLEEVRDLIAARDASAGGQVAARLLRAGEVREVALTVGQGDGEGQG